MAIDKSSLQRWKAGNSFTARDYVYERDLMVDEINRISAALGLTAGEIDLAVNTITVGGHLLSWGEEGTLDVEMDNGVTLQVGQEFHFYAKALEYIKDGAPVQFAGAQGGHLLIKNCVPAEINAHPEYFIGVATHEFSGNGVFGYVTTQGKVNGLDTTIDYGRPLDEEDPDTYILWYNSQEIEAYDGLVNIKPDRGYAQIRVAAITNEHQNQGSIFVRPAILEGGTIQQIFIQETEPTNPLDNDLWFQT